MPDRQMPTLVAHRNVTPLTAKQIRDAERDKVYIFNVSSRMFRVQGPDNRIYQIPACREGESVSEPLVIDGTIYVNNPKRVIGMETEFERVPVDGTDAADDILGTAPFKHESENLVRWGCFRTTSEFPTEEEIAAATVHWHERCTEIVQEADRIAAVDNGMVMMEGGRRVYGIGKDAREAVKVLGLQRPYAETNLSQVRCDECSTGNLPTAAKCIKCGVVINEEAFKRKFPLEWAAREAVLRPAEQPTKSRERVAA